MASGRPTMCTVEITNTICKRIADGESLRSICSDEGLPEKASVLYWVVEGRYVEGTEELFSDHYMRAREAGGFSHADRIIDTVDKVASGEFEPNQAKAMLDGLKWAAERMAPKKHSPRQEIDHRSPDGSMSPKPAIDVSKLSTGALEELLNVSNTDDNPS